MSGPDGDEARIDEARIDEAQIDEARIDEAPGDGAPQPPRAPRPILERIGMAAIAVVLAILFGGVAAAAWIGQEPFLAVMAAIGCLMTVWVGGMTLFRG